MWISGFAAAEGTGDGLGEQHDNHYASNDRHPSGSTTCGDESVLLQTEFPPYGCRVRQATFYDGIMQITHLPRMVAG
jgi:hypothetical protein